MSEGQETPDGYWLMPDGSAMSLSEYQAMHERQHLDIQAFHREVKGLFFTELSEDQLRTMQRVFRRLADPDLDAHNLLSLVSWYEGIIDGAVFSREESKPLTLDGLAEDV